MPQKHGCATNTVLGESKARQYPGSNKRLTRKKKHMNTITTKDETQLSRSMNEVGIATAAPEKMVLAVISHLNKGEIDDALALFGDQFSFKDHGIELEFNSKDRLAEFFRKARELYPDTLVRTKTIFVSGQHVISEWTLQATLIEPAFGNLRQKVPISLNGVSVVLAENGKIKRWSDYYDGLVSRRTALASYFTEWVEY
ncbi:MAG TPA: nuclear transport factor 2 family protein [Candidatus Tectomicrobia bacterium]|nr:nuclear transport factor 2 family protein [Candidatus Tectomicrobia bacterium]